MKKIIMNEGDKFNRLTVIKELSPTKKYERKILCKCDCGNEKIADIYDLFRDRTKSCGCYAREIISTHGMHKTRFYKIWQSIKRRTEGCGKYNQKYYINKGMELSWYNDFLAFKKDMYESYLEHCNLHGENNTSIDRINNNEGYYISNCRWATRQVQQRNTSKTILFSYNGTTKCLKDWCEELGLNYKSIHSKIKYRNINIKIALGL